VGRIPSSTKCTRITCTRKRDDVSIMVLSRSCIQPSAITQSDINEYVSHYSSPGGMHAGFEYYRAFPQDAIDNQNYSKTKLTMPVLALGGDLFQY
jgi:hypothetical protein